MSIENPDDLEKVHNFLVQPEVSQVYEHASDTPLTVQEHDNKNETSAELDTPRVIIASPSDRVTDAPVVIPIVGPETKEELATAQPSEPAPSRLPPNDLKLVGRVTPDANAQPQKGLPDRPEVGKVETAAKEGIPQRLVIVRTEQDGPLRYLMDDSLVPPKAFATTTPSEAAATDETDSNPLSMFTGWARIAMEQHAPPEKPLEGFRVHGITQNHNGPFAIVFDALPVPADVQDTLRESVGIDLHDAKETEGQESLASKLEAVQGGLTKAIGSALVRQEVVVGAVDETSLEKVAKLTAHSALPSDDATSWVPEPQVHRTPEKATEAGIYDLEAYVPVDTFVDVIRYPADKEVPGVRIKEIYEWAVNRVVPPGEQTIKFGTIMDGSRPAGDLLLTKQDFARGILVLAGSGAGKTVLMRQLAVNFKHSEINRLIDAVKNNVELTPDDLCALVLGDFQKKGNLAYQIAAMMKGLNLPEEYKEYAQVISITPGGGGLRVNFDIFEPNHITVSEQLDIGVDMQASGIKDPERQAIFKKFLKASLAWVYTENGWNLEANKPSENSRYPKENGNPASPDLPAAKAGVERYLASTKFANDVIGNIGSFTVTELADKIRGSVGQLFQLGFPLDWNKVRRAKPTVVFNLGGITDPTAKMIIQTAIFHGLIGAQAGEHPEGGDVSEPEVAYWADEAGGLFDKGTEVGETNAQFATKIRGLGLALGLWQQGRVSDIHEDVTNNMKTIIAGLSSSKADLEALAPRMGNTDPGKLAGYLTAIPDAVDRPEGHFLAFTRNMPNGPVHAQVTNPDSVDTGPPDVRDARDLVNMGPFEGLHNEGIVDIEDAGKYLTKAREWLLTTHEGWRVRIWAETGSLLHTYGRMVPLIDGEFKDKLRAMTGEDAIKRDFAIALALQKSVNPRHDLLWAAPLLDITNHLVYDVALPQVRDLTKEPTPVAPHLHLALDVGRFSTLKDHAVDHLTAAQLPEEELVPYQKTLGKAIVDEIKGTTASDQFDNLLRVQHDMMRGFTKAVAALSKLLVTNPEALSADSAATMEAVQTYKRLTAGASTEPLTESTAKDAEVLKGILSHLSIKLDRPSGEAYVRENLEKGLVKGIGAAEEAVLSIIKTIAEGVTQPESTEDAAKGFPTLQRALAKAIIKGYQNPEELDLSDWEGVYGPLRAETNHAKLQLIIDLEKEFLAKSRQKISRSRLVLAPDQLDETGGITLDKIVASFIKQPDAEDPRDGPIHRLQDEAYKDTEPPLPTIIELLKRNDPRIETWKRIISTEIIHSPNFKMTPGAKRFLLRFIGGEVSVLESRAIEANQRAKEAKQGDQGDKES